MCLQVRVSRSVVTVWLREMRSATVALLNPRSVGRGTPVVHLVIAPSTLQPAAGETITRKTHLHTPTHTPQRKPTQAWLSSSVGTSAKCIAMYIP